MVPTCIFQSSWVCRPRTSQHAAEWRAGRNLDGLTSRVVENGVERLGLSSLVWVIPRVGNSLTDMMKNGGWKKTGVRATLPPPSGMMPSHAGLLPHRPAQLSEVDSREQDGTGQREWDMKDLEDTIFELQDQVKQHQAVQRHSEKAIQDLEYKVMCLEKQNAGLEKHLRMCNKRMEVRVRPGVGVGQIQWPVPALGCSHWMLMGTVLGAALISLCRIGPSPLVWDVSLFTLDFPSNELTSISHHDTPGAPC
ncbi:uncharacterized protein [Narcine bancroftii]|uniref:uncharacterized protein n=1 Tax=Narcine bancroftii TaxID=1343680 RepID=UPI0038313180